jgi:ATP-dependent Clp protease ATP-binding subunit ClpC
LQVTFRGLDLRSARPNAVILLSGEAAENSERLADAVAETLFGSPERSTVIDLSRMVDAESITALLGAPPMYVGYAEALPIHRVAQMPWSVLRLEGIDACHPQIRQVISRALAQGYFTDGRGKDIFLSDTVVILTASIWVEAHRSLGFQTKNGSPSVDIQRAVVQTLGEDLAGLIDLCSVHTAPLTSNGAAWIENELLGGLSRRYLEQGIQLQWDKSLVDWLMTQRDLYANERDWERFVDEKLSLNIIQHLPEERSKTVLPVTVRYDGEKVLIESAPEPENKEHGI